MREPLAPSCGYRADHSLHHVARLVQAGRGADLAVVPGFSRVARAEETKVVEFSARIPPVSFFPAVWYCDGSIANLVFDPSSFSSRGAAMAKAISFRLPPSQSPPLDLLAVTGFANGTGKNRGAGGGGDASKHRRGGGVDGRGEPQ